MTFNELRKLFKKRIKRGCYYCGTHKNLTIDHKHPKQLGGKTNRSNTQCLCYKCNSLKSGIPHRHFIRILFEYETRMRGKSKMWKFLDKRIKKHHKRCEG